MRDYKINICHLYPDILNLYGDTGNILCMKKRLEWRGIECSVDNLYIGDKLNSADYDIFFIGGGQDFEQEILLNDANKNKKLDIKHAIDEEKVFLAICGGYQILGNYYKTWDGQEHEFMGCIDVHTEAAKDRMIGDYIFTCDCMNEEKIVGFENHSGKTYLGKGMKPIGRVFKGFGNNGQDGMEGVHYKNLFASYSHGPMLPKNINFCDMLLEKALNRKYGSVSLKEIDSEFEKKAHDYMEKRLLQK